MIPNYYEKKKSIKPILLVPQMNIFPGQITHFDIDSEDVERLLEIVMREKSTILVLAMRDGNDQDERKTDYFPIGTIMAVRQFFLMPNGRKKFLVEGLERGEIVNVIRTKPYMEAEVLEYHYLPEKVEMSEEISLLMRLVANSTVDYLRKDTQIPDVFILPLLDISDPGKLSDEIISHLDLRQDELVDLLSEFDVRKRLEKLRDQLDLLSDIAKLDQELTDRTTDRMNQSQREYMLREQLNIIREELGEESGDPSFLEDGYRSRIEALDMPEESKEYVLKEVDKLSYLSPMSPEVNVSRSYLDTILDLPWGSYTKDNKDLAVSREILDKYHYGLKDVKERILEFIAVRQLRKDAKGSILCLVGPPGVGKTSIVRSIAHAINREFTSMRLGGVTDESEIRGHRKTYVGSMPGRIITQMTKCNSMNPVFLFDEVDKIGSDFRGDPASALLEVLDPEQNREFLDRYLEIAFDLSQVMFITTANTTDTIPGPLLDRMEVIRISGYTVREKFEIAKRFLIPKTRKESGLTAKQVNITDTVIMDIINYYTREAGVRELERRFGKIMRRAAKRIVEGEDAVRVKQMNLIDYLGEPIYREDDLMQTPEVGLVNGLAWTEVGGEILHIEANVMNGHGALQLTGSLGNVMKESAAAAISYIRSNANRYGIDENFYHTQDIHIHMPEGAVPKDGPSAGVSITTAVVSALTNRPIRNDIAMTGEITLTGKVLAIGGVKEKVLAAKRYHIQTVLLPKPNMRDLKELEEESIAGMKFIPLETIDDVIRYALLDPVEVKPTIIFASKTPTQSIGFGFSQGTGEQA